MLHFDNFRGNLFTRLMERLGGVTIVGWDPLTPNSAWRILILWSTKPPTVGSLGFSISAMSLVRWALAALKSSMTTVSLDGSAMKVSLVFSNGGEMSFLASFLQNASLGNHPSRSATWEPLTHWR